MIFVNQGLRSACLERVVGWSGTALVETRPDGAAAPSANVGCGVDSPLWAGTGGLAMQVKKAGLRINWASQRPTLERLVVLFGGAEGQWVPEIVGVEQLKVRVGIGTLADPGAVLQWFPDATTGAPPVDQCTHDTCLPILRDVQASEQSSLELTAAQQAVMRRVRMIEVDLMIRSEKPQQDAIVRKKDGSFALDSDGLPRDGYKRRQLTVQVSPRNFTLHEE